MVQLVEIRHLVTEGRVGAVCLQAGVIGLALPQDRARRTAGKDHDAEASIMKLARRIQRSHAAFNHVRDQGYTAREPGGDTVHLIERARCLNEKHIGPRIDIGFGAYSHGGACQLIGSY